MATTGPATWPSSSTWPGAAVYPGQGNFPIVRVRVALDDVSVAAPVWQDVTDRVRVWSTSRGRNTELDQFDAGTASVALQNRDRAYDPAVFFNVRPLNRVWIYAEFSAATYDIFRGYTFAWEQTWPGPGTSDAIATLSAVDEFKRLGLLLTGALGVTVPQTMYANDWINYILDLAASKAPRRLDVHDNVESAIQTSSSGQLQSSVLSELQDAARYDGGDRGLFVTAGGAVRFVSANYRGRAPGNTVQATFGDQGGSELPYLDLTTDYSDQFLINDYIATWSGSPAGANDAASITTYGKRTRSEDFPRYTVAPSNFASVFVGKYKNPMIRATTIQPELADANTAEAVLRLELLDRIRLLRTPPGGGGRFDQQLFVQKIQLSGQAGYGWDPVIRCTLGVSPL